MVEAVAISAARLCRHVTSETAPRAEPAREEPHGGLSERLFYREDGWVSHGASRNRGPHHGTTNPASNGTRGAADGAGVSPDPAGPAGLGHPPFRGFEYSWRNLATFVHGVMDKAGVESDTSSERKRAGPWRCGSPPTIEAYPDARCRRRPGFASWRSPTPSPIPQRDRLGSKASKEMVEYWNMLFSDRIERVSKGSANRSRSSISQGGRAAALTAPTLVITADRTKMHSVEKARAYQVQIPNSRLVSFAATSYHIAAATRTSASRTRWRFSRSRRIGNLLPRFSLRASAVSAQSRLNVFRAAGRLHCLE